MVTGCEMRYSKSSPSSPAEASATMVLEDAPICPCMASACACCELGARRRHGRRRSLRHSSLSRTAATTTASSAHASSNDAVIGIVRLRIQHRRRRGIVRQFRRRPLHVLRRIQLAHKRNRPPRHQRELHLVPILARGVIDDRPSFEHRLPAGRQNQPVARFPNRRWNHVTGLHLALLGVGGIDIHAALLLRPRRRQRLEILLELPLQFRVGEANAGRRAQIHGSHFAAIQHQRELLALRLLLARGFACALRQSRPATVSPPNFSSTRAPFN